MTDRVVASSRDAIRAGSKSFSLAAALFDRACREDAYQLYAWCRHCDDEIDGQSLGHDRLEPTDVAPGVRVSEARPPEAHPPEARLERLRDLTDLALAGEDVDDPAFLALGRVVRRHGIPHRYPHDLLAGFAMDVEGRRFGELDDCLTYCYHVAGVVGIMMAYVMGARDAETLDRATDLGIAFQLTNISRDVVADAVAGRLYLPLSWLDEAGIPPHQVAARRYRQALFEVVDRLLDEADRYYESAAWGLPALGLRSAWAVATASYVYRDIGTLLRRRGARAWDRRAVVGRGRKIRLALAGALQAALASPSRSTAPPSREALWHRPSPSGGG